MMKQVKVVVMTAGVAKRRDTNPTRNCRITNNPSRPPELCRLTQSDKHSDVSFSETYVRSEYV